MKTNFLSYWAAFCLAVAATPAFCGSLVFDGASDYLNVPDSNTLDLTGDFTLEVWVKLRQVNRTIGGLDWQCLFAKSAYNSSYGLMLNTSSVEKTLRFYHTGASPAMTDYYWTDVESNRWYHVAVTFQSGRAAIFVDGELQVENTLVTGTVTANNAALLIGRSSTGGYPFDGQLDEVRIWNVARAATEIQADLSRSLTGTESGLAAYYRFDEGAGTMAHDATPNGNNAALVNGPLWSWAGSPGSEPAVFTEAARDVTASAATLVGVVESSGMESNVRFEIGPESPCLSFDGSSQYVHVSGFGTNAPTTEVTIEFWQKVDALRDQSTFVLNPDVTTGNRINAHVPWSNGEVYWDFGGGRLNYRPPVSIVGMWQHFALVASQTGNFMRIYRNGVLEAQKTGMTPFTPGNYDLMIGGKAGYRFQGQIDEFRMWKTARTTDEIRTNMFRAVLAGDTNLVGYWKFDEGNGVRLTDSSPAQRDGIIVNNPNFEMWTMANRPSYTTITEPAEVEAAGNVLHLDGINDYVEVPPAVWFNGDFTVEGWINPQSHGSWYRLIDFGNGQNSDNILVGCSSGTSGRPACEIRRGGTIVGAVAATQPIPLNRWTHLAATLQGTVLTLYVNGAVAAVSSSQAPNNVVRSRNYLGRSNWADAYANALMDEVRIWRVARSRVEIVEAMNQHLTGDEPDLGGCWSFDEAGGLTVFDSSTNAQHATMANGAERLAVRAVCATLPHLQTGTAYHYRVRVTLTNGVELVGEDRGFTTVNSAGGNALALDGVDDFVRVGANVIPSSGDFTVEAWAYLPALPLPHNYREVLSQGTSGNAFYLGYYNGDRCIRAGDGWGTTGVPFPLGAWAHIAVVKTSGNTLLYTNGVLARSKGSTIPNPVAVGFFDIGRQYGGYTEFWPGKIDEIRVWSVARDASQILLNFNRHLTGNEAGLVGLYQFDEGAGDVALDASPSQNHGLLYGGVTRSDSRASVGLPVGSTLGATQVTEDRATLNGAITTDGAATTVWFEWGTNVLLSETTQNVGVYYNVGGSLGGLGAVNWNGWNPSSVRQFASMDFVDYGWPGGPGDYFATRNHASLYLPRDGTYTFFVGSDDGSQLYIDGYLVVNNDGLHGYGERAGSIYLKAGEHFLETFFFENTGYARLQLYYSGPGIPKQNIDLSALREPVPVFEWRTAPQVVVTATQAVSTALSELWPGTHYYRLVSANARGTNYGALQAFEVLNPYSLTALSFDGFSDYVLTPNLRSYFTNETVTIEAWFNANGPGIIIDERGRQDLSGWADSQIEIVSVATNSAKGEVKIRVYNLVPGVGLSLGTVDFGTWNHVVLRYDKSTLKLDGFLNGTQSTNYAIGDRSAPWESGHGLFYGIGLTDSTHLGSGAYFNGLMDEVRIWSVARTQQDILDNYTRRLSSNQAGLVAYYRFDDRTGTTAVDSSPNGNHATLFTSVNVLATTGNGPTWVPSSVLANHPITITLPAIPVQAKSAALHGLVNPSTRPTSARFEWGTTTNYGKFTASRNVGAGISFVAFDEVLVGLDPGVSYHYRLRAGNDAGLSVGEDQMFTTLTVGVGWPVATKVSQWDKAFSPRHAVDGAGNVYLAGGFSIPPESIGGPIYPAGSTNVAFVSKLSARGDWAWMTNAFSASNSLVQIHAIAVDRATNVYVAGECNGTNQFGTVVLSSPSGCTNGFLAKLDHLGNWSWATSFGGTGCSGARGVAIGTNGSVYLAGQFSGTHLQFGTNTFSAVGGADILLGKVSEHGEWIWVRSAGTPADGEAACGIAVDPTEQVFITGRFSGSGVFGLNSAGLGDMFVAHFDSEGSLQYARRGGGTGEDAGTALTVNSAGNVFVLARFFGAATYDTSQLPTATGTNLAVMRLKPSLGMDWITPGPAVRADSIALDRMGYAYVTGEYEQTVLFGSITLSSAGGTDLFVGQMPTDVLGTVGTWNWVKSIGDLGSEGRGTVAVDFSGDVLVSGSFQNSLQMGYVSVSVLADQDIFVARLRTDGSYEHNTWSVGQAVPIPAEAKDLDDRPLGKPTWIILDKMGQTDADAMNSFVWSEGDQQLYPVRRVTALIKWPTSAGDTNATKVISAVGDCVWPESPQIHIAGAPVELDPQNVGFRFKYLGQPYSSSAGAAVDASTLVFNATQPGYTVLQFLRTEGYQPDPLTQPSVFEVVRTVAWNDAVYLANDSAVVGTTITGPRPISGAPAWSGHNDPTGKNGFVLFANALYDGSGPDRAYDRATRNGPIIPVNKVNPATNDDLVVVWYHTNTITGVAWPATPVRYQLGWPENPERIVIASQLGFGPVDPVRYPAAQVYHQPNPAQPGFNPNEEHALLVGETLYALRDDLNELVRASAPYVLLKYRSPFDNRWTIKVLKVEAEDTTYRFDYAGVAGEEIPAPRPLRFMSLCRDSIGKSGPYYEDYNGKLYARAAGPMDDATNIVLHWFYPLHPSFFYELTRPGSNDVPVGTCIPWLDRRFGGTPGVPTDVTYRITWPSPPGLEVGENLLNPKLGLPGIRNWASAEVIYDQVNAYGTNASDSLVRLYDPLSERVLQLRPSGSLDFAVRGGWDLLRVPEAFNLVEGLNTANIKGKLVFVDLPYSLRSRLSYDPLNKNLSFLGLLNETADYGGPDNPLILVNVMTERERDRIKRLDGEHPVDAQTGFDDVVDALFHLTRNPNRLDVDHDGSPDKDWLIGLAYGYVTNVLDGMEVVVTNIVHERLGDRVKLLTAAPGTGSGYVTLVQNNDQRLAGLPVTLTVLRIDGGPYRGDLKVLLPDNVFDEKLTLRHSADFGGVPEPLEFEWYYQPAGDTSVRTNLPYLDNEALVLNGWTYFGGGHGMNDITIGDGGTSSLLTLSDNYFVCRYRGYAINGETNWSDWVGVIGGGEAQLAPGWIKRAVLGLNPFEARSKDFHESPTATYASMIQQAGSRYEGDIAFNPSADNLNSIGLISAYETVLRRGRRLSIDSVEQINDSAANNALLLAAGRVAEFYMLLGNEAYADAADPTIGFRTDQSGYGTLAPSIFTFQNQLDSLLEEELALLRGRDDRSATVKAPPFYNRLIWNFTKNEGEVAYSQTYNMSDQNSDGLVNAEDGRIMYPQGHGDAWGHYLTSTKTYYELLRNPNYTWEPRTEDILLAGIPVEVDYQDERKFVRAASAKAKTGAEILDLTYRLKYVDAPDGQYQGYKDTNPDRAWGFSEWGRRAGQGAYFDWAMANAILPATDPKTNHVGIQKIDRSTVQELSEIVAAFNTVQDQLDKADLGLNPLGLAKNVVPFDIDPTHISAGKTHFEQIYDRALSMMGNTITVFNHANQLSQSLRALQDSVDDMSINAQQQERDYKNRLIEVFGYPYVGDIGPGGTYPSGYDGPDLYHYMYVNTVELNGDTAPASQTFTAFYSQIQNIDHSTPGTMFDFAFGKKEFFFPEDLATEPGDRFTNDVLQVSYPFTPADFGFVAPSGWGQRRAPGEVQIALSEMVQAHARLQRAQLNYDNLLQKIQDHIDLLEARYAVAQETVRIRNEETKEALYLKGAMVLAKAAQRSLKFASYKIQKAAEVTMTAMPKSIGFSTDAFAALRGGVAAAAFAGTAGLEFGAITFETIGEGLVEARNQLEKQTSFEIDAQGFAYEVQQQFKVMEDLLRQEIVSRVEAFELAQALEQSSGRYQAALAKGQRLVEERAAFRRNMAAQTQEHRYRDMTFRIFRNDAIQKYRAQFDLAARYVFLAAVAYDFETQLLGGDNGAGREFLTDIIRQRSLGQMEGGVPVAGRHGLADPLARLGMNFAVLKGQMGFNNPQTETGRFSLRRELFRLGEHADADWRAELKKHLVANLWEVPEFRRYCRPFAPETAGAQPGLVLRFPTTVTFGLNYFGWPLGGGDSAYDSSLFATKVRSVGVWFADYNGSGLSVTPRVYLVPVGADVMRSPSGSNLETREWRVVDQKIPIPFPIGYSSLQNAAWIPANNSLSDSLAEIRRFSSFRAYHDSGYFTPAEAINDSRLIGRSVWNTEWLLIIPGGTFLYEPNQGLETFINTVGDIKIFFQTYAYSGN